MNPPHHARFVPSSRESATNTLASLDATNELWRGDETNIGRTTRPTVAHLFINNSVLTSKSKDWTTVLDPVSSMSALYRVCRRLMLNKATGSLLSRVPASTHQEIQSAVDAAQAAQQGWNDLGFFDRRDCLFRLAGALKEMAPAIVRPQSQQQGTSALIWIADWIAMDRQHASIAKWAKSLPRRIQRSSVALILSMLHAPLGLKSPV